MENKNAWLTDLDVALETAQQQGKGIFLQFHREECAGCKKLYAITYQQEAVAQEISQWFVPLRLDIFQHRQVRARYSAFWTPSFYFLDYHGKMLHSFNGYLNAEDFRVLLRLGKAAIDIPRGKYLQVIELMDEGLEKFSNNPKAAAMLFTRGMAAYLLGNEKGAFREAMTEIRQAYPDSPEARMWPWMDE